MAAMTRFTYFAYGSNLLIERLQARCASARFLGTATTQDYDLAFCKTGKDGSGKATLIRRADRNIVLHGALYEILYSERPVLDECEDFPNGYERLENFEVRAGRKDGDCVLATTYIATSRACNYALKPFDWYKALVIAGARQHGFPRVYIDHLAAQPSLADPFADRASHKEALSLLTKTPPSL